MTDSQNDIGAPWPLRMNVQTGTTNSGGMLPQEEMTMGEFNVFDWMAAAATRNGVMISITITPYDQNLEEEASGGR